ncbi:MAG: glycosyltransferase family 1 protein [Chloroflexi bacterium]|nr:glycosyltransferase family 1 protein [Chloroflexota bacterium]
MKITILTYGSRGDVQPFLALALGLQGHGHEVKLAAPHRFAGFVGEHHVPFVPLAGDPEEISVRINAAGTNPVRVIASIRDYVFSIAPQVSRAAFAACEGADFLIHSFLFTVGGHSWAREHGVPDVSVQTFPMFAPTRAFPNPAAAQFPPGILSYLSHWMTAQAFWFGGNSGYGPARRAHPDVDYPKKLYWPFDKSQPLHLRTSLLCAYSPNVLPRPGDWPEHAHVTGYLFLDDENYQPPHELVDFLSAGDAPICVNFGSMVNRDAERISREALRAVASTNRRAIMLTGWGGYHPRQIQEDVLYLDAVPHYWLLPRCSLLIHHGGAGTTAAGFRAGIPQIVIPHTADQPFWGKRVHTLGVGPAPISIGQLSARRLASAIERVGAADIQSRARDLGQLIGAEHGVDVAVKLIEGHFYEYRNS